MALKQILLKESVLPIEQGKQGITDVVNFLVYLEKKLEARRRQKETPSRHLLHDDVSLGGALSIYFRQQNGGGKGD